MSPHPILVKLPFWTQEQTFVFIPVNIHLVNISPLFWFVSFWISIPLSNMFTILSSCVSFINPVSVTFSLHPSLCWRYWKRTGTRTKPSLQTIYFWGLVLNWQQIYSIIGTFTDVLECHVDRLKSAIVGVFIPQELADDTNQSQLPLSSLSGASCGVFPSTPLHAAHLYVPYSRHWERLLNTSKLTHVSLQSLTAYKTGQYALCNLVLSTSP